MPKSRGVEYHHQYVILLLFRNAEYTFIQREKLALASMHLPQGLTYYATLS